MEEKKSLSDELSEFGKKWNGFAAILSVVIALLVFFGAGTYFYNQVWQSKALFYSIFPSLDLGTEYFNGFVISNGGQVTLTDVQIILSDLETNINQVNMPGAHESISIVSGGVGEDNISLSMKRLLKGDGASFYLLSDKPLNFEEGTTFYISSNETKAVSAEGYLNRLRVWVIVLVVILVILCLIFLYILAAGVDKMKKEAKKKDELIKILVSKLVEMPANKQDEPSPE